MDQFEGFESPGEAETESGHLWLIPRDRAERDLCLRRLDRAEGLIPSVGRDDDCFVDRLDQVLASFLLTIWMVLVEVTQDLPPVASRRCDGRVER